MIVIFVSIKAMLTVVHLHVVACMMHLLLCIAYALSIDNIMIKKLRQKYCPTMVLYTVCVFILKRNLHKLCVAIMCGIIFEVWYATNAFQVIYVVPFVLMALYTIMKLDTPYLLHLVLATFLSDTLQQMIGSSIGSMHWFSTSPNKTVEGYLGTIIVMWALFGIKSIRTVVLPGIAGDLYASSIKRRHNIKDFSHALGSIGGLYDRFDSQLFVFAFLLIGNALSNASLVPRS